MSNEVAYFVLAESRRPKGDCLIVVAQRSLHKAADEVSTQEARQTTAWLTARPDLDHAEDFSLHLGEAFAQVSECLCDLPPLQGSRTKKKLGWARSVGVKPFHLLLQLLPAPAKQVAEHTPARGSDWSTRTPSKGSRRVAT